MWRRSWIDGVVAQQGHVAEGLGEVGPERWLVGGVELDVRAELGIIDQGGVGAKEGGLSLRQQLGEERVRERPRLRREGPPLRVAERVRAGQGYEFAGAETHPGEHGFEQCGAFVAGRE